MKKFLLVFSALVLFPACSLSQVSQLESKAAVAPYQKATLLKLTAHVRTQTEVVSQAVFQSAELATEKTVTYTFAIRSGDRQYVSQYTPAVQEQPGNLPHAWWLGKTPVEMRVSKSKLFIKLPEGGEVVSLIVSQTILATK